MGCKAPLYLKVKSRSCFGKYLLCGFVWMVAVSQSNLPQIKFKAKGGGGGGVKFGKKLKFVLKFETCLRKMASKIKCSHKET